MVKVPEGWKCVPLDEVATIQTGLAKGKNYSAKTVRVPYLRVANVQDGYLDLAEIKEIEVLPSEVERYQLQFEDVLLTEGGDFDKLGRGDIWRGEIPLCLHQNHIFVVRTNRAVLDPYFFTYQTSSPYGKQYFLASSKQSTNLASINSTQLREFPVLLPPLAEQRKIAAILSTWDAAITLTRQLIAALQRRKQALMQLLLTGAVRFPGFADEWEEAELGAIATVIMGQSPPSEFYNSVGDGLPLIQGNADIDNRKTAPRVFTSAITKICQVGDIILSVRAPVGETARSLHEACLGRGVAAIRATLSDPDFLYQEMVFSEQKWQTFAQGSTFTAINSTDIRTFELQVPASLDEQSRIAEVLKFSDMEIDNLDSMQKQLTTQKRGLMQQLLTGALRTSP